MLNYVNIWPVGPVPPELNLGQLAALVEYARDKFLARNKTQTGSMRAVAARILFDDLRDNIRDKRLEDEVRTKHSRATLRDKVKNHPEWDKKADLEKSFGSTPDEITDELNKWGETSDYANGLKWTLHFGGPLHATRAETADDGLLWLTLYCARAALGTAPPATAPTGYLLSGFVGRCFCCPNNVGKYSTTNRRCKNKNCYSNLAEASERCRYVSIFPEPSEESEPTIGQLQTEMFFQFVGSAADAKTLTLSDTNKNYANLFPYRRDFLAEANIRLGRPLLYRAAQFQPWTGFRNVFTLDFSTFTPSNTLKDPKSWAVINVALEAGISSLIVYTAGNAGISLAKLVSEVNRRIGANLNVFALVEKSVPTNVRQVLRAWGAETEELVLGETDPGALPESEVWRVYNARRHRIESNEPSSGAWHVSEGWDGVGILMYRALFADLLSRVRVDYIVLPVGQGNLFLGAYLGRQDAKANSTLLVGTVPLGENVLHGCREVTAAEKSVMGVAPKLAGRNTPLAQCICHASQRSSITFVEVSRKMQVAAAGKGEIRRMAVEPSASIAFGALMGDERYPGLFQQATSGHLDSRKPAESTVIVVNSGLGLIADDDAKFVSDWP